MCWGSYHAGLLEGISEDPLGLLGSCDLEGAPSNSPGGPAMGGFTSPEQDTHTNTGYVN